MIDPIARPARTWHPLSTTQQNRWMQFRQLPSSQTLSFSLRLEGRVEECRIDEVLGQVFGRHPMLRAHLREEEGLPSQAIGEGAPFRLRFEDAHEMDEHALEALISLHATEAFEAEADWKAAARLYRRGPEAAVLLLTFSHLVVDGWSFWLLVEEIGAAIDGRPLAAETSGAPSYLDYVHAQREWLAGEQAQRQAAYWSEHLGGTDDASFAAVFPAVTAPGAVTELRHRVALAPDITERLREIAAASGASLFATLFGLYQLFLCRGTDAGDVVVGTMLPARPDRTFARVVGDFANPVAIRSRFSASETVVEALKVVSAGVRSGMRRQLYPFSRVVEQRRDAGETAMPYSTAFVFQDGRGDAGFGALLAGPASASVAWGELNVSGYGVIRTGDLGPLSLVVEALETAGHVVLDFRFRRSLDEGVLVGRLAQTFVDFVNAIAQCENLPSLKWRTVAVDKLPFDSLRAKHAPGQPVALSIAATFVAEPLDASLRAWLHRVGFAAEVAFAPYNQPLQALRGAVGGFRGTADGVNVVLVRTEDWLREATPDIDENGLAALLRVQAQAFLEAAQDSAVHTSRPLIVVFCPDSPEFEARKALRLAAAEVRADLAARLAELRHVHVTPVEALRSLGLPDQSFDAYLDAQAHVPFTAPMYATLARFVARHTFHLRRPPYKVIVLDCDNTLWGGVCAEVGAMGIALSAPYLHLQSFMRAQCDAGMLLCLASKNDSADVDAVFAQRSDMVLRATHIAASRVNWNPKSRSLRELADELGLGLDSFVFIDDNPVECAEVALACPEVAVLQLPTLEEVPAYLQQVWAFDHLRVTDEAAQRTQLYAQEKQRRAAQRAAVSFDDFLAGLELKVDIDTPSEVKFERCAELTRRTNQFNLDPIPQPESQLRALAEQRRVLAIDVRDRFGAYGLTGLVSYVVESGSLVVNAFLLSCRVLGRGVELQVLRELARIAADARCADIVFGCRTTQRNQPMRDFLNGLGGEVTLTSNGQRHVIPLALAATVQPRRVEDTFEEPEAQEASAPATRLRVPRDPHALHHVALATPETSEFAAARVHALSAAGIGATIEAEVVAIFRTLLGKDLGRNDDFFERGGHSLMAIQVVSLVRSLLHVEMPLGDFFAAPSITGVARAIERLQAIDAAEAGVPLVPADRSASIPVSLAQQRLWFLDRLDGALGATYTIRSGVTIRGKLDVAALKMSFDRLLARHEALRTTFEVRGGEPVQVIASRDVGFALRELDLDALSTQARQAELERTVADEARAPFDLERGPLIRGCLIRVDDNEHVLLVTQHHAVTDGWSNGILIAEVSALYDAYTSGRGDPLPPLVVQYADYSVWQRRALEAPMVEHQLDFWRAQLAGAPALIELPTDRPRPPAQSYRGAALPLRLPATLTASLRELGQRRGATLFMTLLAGWAALLSRWSGQSDVVIGTAVANRQRPELVPVIGFFLNTLALRIDLDREPDVSELLARVRRTTLAAYNYQDVPFEQVVDALQPARSFGHAPLFQVMFALNNTPTPPLALRGLEVATFPTPRGVAHYDLMLSLAETEAGIEGHIDYATDLFDATTIAKLRNQLLVLLGRMAGEDTVKIGALSLLEETERQRLLVEWNDTDSNYPRDMLVHELFEQQARQRPGAVALVFEGASLSYGELDLRANRLAQVLLDFDLQPDDRVAVCLERGIDSVVALLAILKAGACYVPLDLASPTDRLGYMLTDAAPVVVLTREAHRTTLPHIECPLLVIDEPALEARLAAAPIEAPAPRRAGLTPRHLAYVIYTSGSTGRPKGVMVEHRSVVSLVIGNIYADIGPHDVMAHCSNPTFDAATWEIWGALLNGARMVIVPQGGTLDPEGFGRTLAEGGVTALYLTVALFNAYLEKLGPLFARLRYLILGGDALSPTRIVELIRGGHAPAHLVNGYGPTETTTFAITHEIGPDVLGLRSVPIGRPIANTSIYILDRYGAPVPTGIAGEIHIGGVGVARGYLGRAELTAERFIEDPFASEVGARMYCTGDLGRWLPDGTIEYLGRNDFQVKIRGFRVEPGEIETQLRTARGVRDVVVVTRGDSAGDRRLIAYLLSDDGTQLVPSSLREHLTDRVPDYMVPAAFVTLDSFPLTPNAKLDRAALPEPGTGDPRGSEPHTEAERAVAAVWHGLLHVENLGREDNFFQLGGHSLMAVRLVSRLREHCGVEVSLRDVFAHPTLEAIAALIEHRPAVAALEIPRAERAMPLPLSWSQQRLWFLAELEPAASAAYHIPLSLRLSGRLEVPALRRALDGLVARHEILRTSFVCGADGTPVQHVHAVNTRFALEECDLRHLPAAEQSAESRQLAAAQMVAPFDLARGPLVRGLLMRLGNEEYRLVVTQHHIVSDGWSIGVMVQEFGALYAAFRDGAEDPLPTLNLQYGDYAAWQRSAQQQAAYRRQADYWRQRLTGAPALLTLPCDRQRPPRPSYRGHCVAVNFGPDLVAALRSLAGRHEATMFMVIHAGWAALLSRLSGQADVVVGTAVANRRHARIEPLIGLFVNTLALRTRLDADLTVPGWIGHVREAILAAFDNQDLPFEQVVEAVQPARNLDHPPVFQTMFVLNNAPLSSLALPEVAVVVEEPERTTSQFDLALQLEETANGIAGRLDYATDLFDHATVERMVGQFEVLLRSMAEADTQPVSRLGWLPPAQRELLLNGFNDTARDFPHDLLLHELFEHTASRQPDACAVSFGESKLSYAELNTRANQLAHHLIGQGLRPDDRVAICVERSLEMVIGLLGILKSGACYVPLDPTYPADRLAHMLHDSEPAMLLTQVSRLGALPPHNVPVRVLDSDDFAAELASQLADNPDSAALGVETSHLAYIIYTSGSTGLPKGVMNPHIGVVNRILWGQCEYPLNRADRVLHKTPIGFDPSVFEFFWTFHGGAHLVIARPGAHQDVHYLVDTIVEQGITMIHFVSSMLALFLDRAERRPLPSLRRVVIGGEALAYSVQLRFHDLLPCVELLNLYGPTETAIEVTHWKCVPDKHPGLVPIGRPIANTAIYILDAHGEPVPIGVAGEIHIGGAQVSRGYFGRPELTAERFVLDPFDPSRRGRLYRTGDLGRWLDDGAVEYLGRNDFQVKIRGLRVELGEIEAHIAACENVREVVVLAREDSHGDKRLVAYCVAQPGATLEPAALHAQLAEILPNRMVPSAFVVLPLMPLTANGKVDRSRLPQPSLSALAIREYVAPTNERETLIAKIWQALLGIERVGRDDDFFELGGHSLLAVQFVARLRDALGREIPLRGLFDESTLRGYAKMIGEEFEAARNVAVVIADRETHPGTSWAQQRLWFLDQLDHAASGAYHMVHGLRLRGALDRGALRATFDSLVARHEALRTTFACPSGTPVQVIDPPTTRATFIEEDLRALDAPAQDVAAQDACDNEVRAPFDLARGPLMRVRLLRIADDEHLVIIVMHHIISDAWSVGLLVREVMAIYTALVSGAEIPLEPQIVHYADYAAWQRAWLQGETLDEQVRFWKRYLDGAPPLLALPTDRPRPPVQSYVGGRTALSLKPELVVRLHQLARAHGNTLFMTLLAGWSIVLARLSGQDDIVIGTPIANRPRQEFERVIGLFVNALPLRVRVPGDLTVAQFLHEVKASTVAAYAHQDLPFEQIVESLQPPRSLGHSPLFQANLTLENVPTDSTLTLPGLEATPFALPHASSQFDVALHLYERGDVIDGHFYYASDLFDARTIERLARHFEVVLEAMSTNDGLTLSTLPLLNAEQRRALLEDFHGAPRPIAPNALLHRTFEARAQAHPHTLALICGAKSLSYGELDEQANRLANLLRGRGVGLDCRVALCFERGVDMIVALLAIWKAGAAYVPVDPAYPRERIAALLADCTPDAVLTLSAQTPRLPTDGVSVIALDDEATRQALALAPAHVPAEDAAVACGGRLAYVIYTSGSSGQPKGVMVEHRNVFNLSNALEEAVFTGAAAPTCVGLNASLSFDASVQALVQLLWGRTVVVFPEDIRVDIAALRAYLVQHGVDAFDCTPSQLELMFDEGLFDAEHFVPRAVVVGGEAISPALWQRMARATRTRFFNVYGPTECTVDATLGEVAALGAQPSIGRPLANTRLYILDARDEPVPVGVVGEMHIAGESVARGYLNRVELTAERFVRDPFTSQPGARMYRTGDLARWRDDGSIEYVGRADFQVKLRGFRIELGEIEAQLRDCPLVRDAVVVVREDLSGDKRLIAYVLSQDASAIDPVLVRDFLVSRLPDYMVPSALVTVEAFPLTANGKLDRRALPAPNDTAYATRGYEAPQGATEQTLAEIWASILGVERVGRHDSFFELGGYSLTAIQVVARVRERFGVSLPLATVFRMVTIVELAEGVTLECLKQYETADIDRLAREIDQLSEAEILALLETKP